MASSTYCIETAGQFEPFVRREWLLTNGLGSSASGSLVGCNTRRYHALLCAAMRPPVERYVMLSRIGEIVTINNAEPTYELSVNQFEHHLHPEGYQHLVRFELGETAKWTYVIGDVVIEKEVLLCWKRNVTGIRYRVNSRGKQRVKLELLPFVAMRDFHSLRHGTDAHFELQSWGTHATLMHQKLYLHLASDRGSWREQPFWWFGHVYPVEAFRGLDSTEELWNPGRFTLETDGEESITIWASTEHIDMPTWEKQLALREEAKGQVMKNLPPAASVAVRKLWHAADDFLADKTLPGGRMGRTILAGYPWFMDWGRDTMISLPGILLVTGRFDEALQVLRSFAEHVSQGMVPNRFDDYTGEPHYNTVDASLWFVHAVYEYLRMTRDKNAAGDLVEACRNVVAGYKAGTRFGIRMESDGLITQGSELTQLTWMDAKHGNVAFTPRQGKPVEINALWYHALVLLEEKELAERVKKSFLEQFWISPFRGLNDVVDGGRKDCSVRPNQIFAASLPNSPLSADQQRAVVEVVRRELLTPYGLRTLAASDPKYRGRIEGGPDQRDPAYHNGTVWAWLMGPFIEAYLKVNGGSSKAVGQGREWLRPLLTHMDTDCLGQVAEVFDGDVPHRAAGCFAQAWSVAEVLRAAMLLGM